MHVKKEWRKKNFVAKKHNVNKKMNKNYLNYNKERVDARPAWGKKKSS